MVVLTLLGCGVVTGRCTSTPSVWTDPGLESYGESALEQANAHIGWTDQACLAEVRLTEAAPLGGEVWRTSDGWTVSVSPDELELLDEQLCRVYALEHRPFLRAGNDVFVAGSDETRVDVFARECAKGPSTRVFVDASVAACGLDPLTLEEAFLEEHVFTARALPDAPELPLTFTRTRRPHRPLVRADRTVLQESGITSLPWWWGGEGVVHDELDGNVHWMGLPELGNDWVSAMGADANSIVFHTLPELEERRHWILDRATGDFTEQTLNWPVDAVLTWTDSKMAVMGERVVVASDPQADRPAALGVALRGSPEVQVIPLPQPDVGVLHEAVHGLWPDPRNPDWVLVHAWMSGWGTEEVSDGFYFGDETLYRVDLGSGATQTLWRRNRSTGAPTLQPIGPSPTGAFWVAIGIAGRHQLLGQVDLLTGALAVSHDVCVEPQSEIVMLDEVVVLREWSTAWETMRWVRPASGDAR